MDLILVAGFVFAVLMAIKTAKNMHDHARWMIFTVFWPVSPGLFRLLFVPLIILKIPNIGGKTPYLLATTGVANILVLALLMFRDKRTHPAYLLAAIGSAAMFTPMIVGEMQWWKNIADVLFTI